MIIPKGATWHTSGSFYKLAWPPHGKCWLRWDGHKWASSQHTGVLDGVPKKDFWKLETDLYLYGMGPGHPNYLPLMLPGYSRVNLAHATKIHEGLSEAVLEAAQQALPDWELELQYESRECEV